MILACCPLYPWYIFEVPYKHVLQLCSHFVLQAINIYLQLYQTITKPKISSLLRSILCIPQKSPLTLLERVICVFEIGVDLVLVFVGFGLFQICSHLPFSPYSKDHALQRSTSLWQTFCISPLTNNSSGSDRVLTSLYGLSDDWWPWRRGVAKPTRGCHQPDVNRSCRIWNALFSHGRKTCYITCIANSLQHSPPSALIMLLLFAKGIALYGVSWVLGWVFGQFIIRSPLDNIPGPSLKNWWKGVNKKNGHSCKPWLKLNEGVFPQLFNAQAWDFHREIAEKCGQPFLSMIHDWQCYTTRRQCYQDKGPSQSPSWASLPKLLLVI